MTIFKNDDFQKWQFSKMTTSRNDTFQVKRFTNDVLRILKSQACKQISLNEFPATYAKIFGRAFDITDYGMCNMLDALAELPEGKLMSRVIVFFCKKVV